MNLLDIGKKLEELYKNAIGNNIGYYKKGLEVSPQTSPVMRGAEAVQQAIQSPIPFRTISNAMQKIPVGNTPIAKTALAPIRLASSFTTPMVRGLETSVDTAFRDVPKNLGYVARAKFNPTNGLPFKTYQEWYNQQSSPASKLGANLMGISSHKDNNNTQLFKEAAINLAATAEAPASWYMGGKIFGTGVKSPAGSFKQTEMLAKNGKRIVNTIQKSANPTQIAEAVKEGLKFGMKFGGLNGFISSLAGSKYYDPVTKILGDVAKGTASGTAVGGAMGASAPVAGELIRTGISVYNKLTPKEKQGGFIKPDEFLPKGVGEVKPPKATGQQDLVPVKPSELSLSQNKPVTPSTPQLQEKGMLPVETPQGTLGVGGQPPKLPNGAGSLDNSIAPKGNPIIDSVKSKVNKLYTEALDRFHPLSSLSKKAGEGQAMQNALTGYYGAGSTAEYHVDFELSPILKEVPIDDLRSAAIAFRDIELAGRGIKGSNTGNATEALKSLESKLGPDKAKVVGDTLKKLYAYQDTMTKEYLVDTGIISKEAYSKMRQDNQFYVPFKRVMDKVDEFLGMTPPTKGAGSVSSQNVVYKIKGSDKQIVDPIESIVESTYKMVGLAKRQQVAQTLVSLKDKLPQGVIQEIKGTLGNKPNISVFENGKVKHYAAPVEVVDAAKGLSEEGLNTLIKILATPTRVFRATATGINPEFMAPNVFRDVQSAFVNAGVNPLKWVSGLSHMLKKDSLYQEFLKSGGKTSRISIDRPMLTKTVSDITSKKGFTIKKPSDLLQVLQRFGEYSEQPTRIATFEKTLNEGLKKGLTQAEARSRAAYQAQEATVNFARRGSKTQSINAIYAFLNARAQGVDRLVRTIKNDPKGASLRIGAITVAPAMALYAYNRNFKSYNDPRVLSEYDKNNNFIIMLSDTPINELGGAQFIKIPKGDIGKLANPVEQFLSFAEGKGGDVGKALGSVLQGFSPITNAGDLIPTAIRPIAENAANKSYFTGYDIVPDYKKDYPAKYQSSSYTTPMYRLIGDKLNISPAKTQAIVEGYGTGIAKIGELATRPLIPDQYRSAQNEQGAPVNKTPIVRRVLGGERKTQEEQTAADISKVNSMQFRSNDIMAGINRGDIPLQEGLSQIQKLQGLQTSIPQTSNGITESGGSYYVNINGKYKPYDTPEEAQTAIDKDKFKQSGESFKIVGDNVFRLSKGGTITTTPKIDYETSLNQNKMYNAKTAGDYATWLKLAETQYQNYKTQLQDPTLDELEKIDLQQKVDKLVTDATKYSGYGGFTKSSTKSKSKISYKVTKSSSAKAPKMVKIKAAPKVKIATVTKTTTKPKVAFTIKPLKSGIQYRKLYRD